MTELIPGLPEEIGYECLTRLHFSTHRVASRVCRRWHDLLQSRDFYNHRKKSGRTHKTACLVQALPIRAGLDDTKPTGPPIYSVSVFDPDTRDWHRVEPVPKYPHGLPMFCQVAGCEGKLVLMGGWDPASYQPVRHVFVYDFTTRRWARGRDMPETRSFFASAEFDGCIYIAGGHDENKNAMTSARVYDVRADAWGELVRMSHERDECEGVVVGSEFWVVSGYQTDRQGGFVGSAEVYDIGSGRWRVVDDVQYAWRAGQCPRSCVGVGKDGKLFCWSDIDAGIRVGPCEVGLGERTLLAGSGYQGGSQRLFLAEGQNGKLRKVEAPDEFSGFVQSGCCVEI